MTQAKNLLQHFLVLFKDILKICHSIVIEGLFEMFFSSPLPTPWCFDRFYMLSCSTD